MPLPGGLLPSEATGLLPKAPSKRQAKTHGAPVFSGQSAAHTQALPTSQPQGAFVAPPSKQAKATGGGYKTLPGALAADAAALPKANATGKQAAFSAMPAPLTKAAAVSGEGLADAQGRGDADLVVYRRRPYGAGGLPGAVIRNLAFGLSAGITGAVTGYPTSFVAPSPVVYTPQSSIFYTDVIDPLYDPYWYDRPQVPRYYYVNRVRHSYPIHQIHHYRRRH